MKIVKEIIDTFLYMPEWAFRIGVFVGLGVIYFFYMGFFTVFTIVFKRMLIVISQMREVILSSSPTKPIKIVQSELDNIKKEISDIKNSFTQTITIIGILSALAIGFIGVLLMFKK